MSQKLHELPSNREILVRIQKNIIQARGFVDTLIAETADPSKIGPGTKREVWESESKALQEQLVQLEKILEKLTARTENE